MKVVGVLMCRMAVASEGRDTAIVGFVAKALLHSAYRSARLGTAGQFV